MAGTGFQEGLAACDLHLGGRQGPRRQDEIRHKTAGLAGDDLRLLAHRLDVLAVHQHLHFHFLEALAHGVGDQPGDGQVVAGRGRGRGGQTAEAASNPAINRKIRIFRKETILLRIFNPL